MRESLADKLKDSNHKTVFVLDGGQGTELENRGINVSNPVWSTVPFLNSDFWHSHDDSQNGCSKSTQRGNGKPSDRKIVEEMYNDFTEKGGSDICTTITYQSSFANLQQHTDIKTLEAYRDLMEKIVLFTRDVIGEKKYLIGSFGCYGAHICSEFTGDYGREPEKIDYYNYFKPQLDVFCFSEKLNKRNAIDLIGFETVPNFYEVKGILSWGPDKINKPFYISLSVGDDGKLRDGTDLADVCTLLRQLIADKKINPNFTMLGVNCVSFKQSLGMIENLNNNLQGLDIPLIVYPNSGEEYDSEKKIWLTKDNEDSANISWETLVPQFVKNNCRIIGGCCRTTPADIAKIRKATDQCFA
ncbi:hypothetical protein ACO0QE_003800 [Hanseniaspora vineae]